MLFDDLQMIESSVVAIDIVRGKVVQISSRLIG